MKILAIFVLSMFFVLHDAKLVMGFSCALNYVFYPESYPSKSPGAVYSQTTIGDKVVDSNINPREVKTSFAVKTFTSNVETGPMVVYYVRKGQMSWRVSVIDENTSKIYKSKGDFFMKDENGNKWFTHDKLGKNIDDFKLGFARCQTMNKDFKTRKAFRTQELASKVVSESDLFELIKPNDDKVAGEKNKAISSETSDKDKDKTQKLEEGKEKKDSAIIRSTTTTNQAKEQKSEVNKENTLRINTPVERKKESSPAIASSEVPLSSTNKPDLLSTKVRFMQKEDEMDSLDDEGEMSKISVDHNNDSESEIDSDEVLADEEDSNSENPIENAVKTDIADQSEENGVDSSENDELSNDESVTNVREESEPLMNKNKKHI